MAKNRDKAEKREAEERQREFVRKCVTLVNNSPPPAEHVSHHFSPPDIERKESIDYIDFLIRGVRVFEPVKQFPTDIFNHYCCPNGHKVEFGSGGVFEYRKVLDMTDYFYLAYKRYKCSVCLCTFRNIDDSVLNQMPDVVRISLHGSIVFRKQMALTVQLQDHMYNLGLEHGWRSTARDLNRAYHTQYSTTYSRYLQAASVKTNLPSTGHGQQVQLEKYWKNPSQTQHRPPKYRGLTEEEADRNRKYHNAAKISRMGFKTKHSDGIDVNAIKGAKIEALKTLGERIGEHPNLIKFKEGIKTPYELAKVPIEELSDEEVHLLVGSKQDLKKMTSTSINRLKEQGRTWVANARLAIDEMIDQIESHGFVFEEMQEILNLGPVKQADLLIADPEGDTNDITPPKVIGQEDPSSEVPKAVVHRIIPFPSYIQSMGYFFYHKTISSICMEVYELRKPMIMQRLASYPVHFLSFDSQLKSSKWVKAMIPGSRKLIPLLRSVLLGMNQVGQVVMLHCEDFFERNDELLFCLRELKKNQEKLYPSDHKVHACWTDKCCTRRNAIQECFGKSCSSLLDLFHFMDRFKEFVLDGEKNPRFGAFMNDFKQAMRVRGHDAIKYLQSRKLSVENVVGADVVQKYSRYKAEIDIIPDPDVLLKNFNQVIEKHAKLDAEAHAKNANADAAIQLQVAAKISTKTKDLGRQLTDSEVNQLRKQVHQPEKGVVLFKTVATVNGKRMTFKAFCESQSAHIEKGCLSDPLECGKPLFYLTRNEDQRSFKLQTVRGTNKVENAFKHVKDSFILRSTVGPQLAEMLLLEKSMSISERVVARLRGDRDHQYLSREFCLQANSYCLEEGIGGLESPPFPAHQGSSLDPAKLKFGFFLAGEGEENLTPAESARQILLSLQNTIGRALAVHEEDLKYKKDVKQDGRSCDRAFWAALVVALRRKARAGNSEREAPELLREVFKFFPPYTTVIDHNETSAILSTFRKSMDGLTTSIDTENTSTSTSTTNLGLYKNGSELDDLLNRFFHESTRETVAFLYLARLFTFFAVKEIARKAPLNSKWIQQLNEVLDDDGDTKSVEQLKSNEVFESDKDQEAQTSEENTEGACGSLDEQGSSVDEEEDSLDEQGSSVDEEEDLLRSQLLAKLTLLENSLCRQGQWERETLDADEIADWRYVSLLRITFLYFLDIEIKVTTVDRSGDFAVEHALEVSKEAGNARETVEISLGSGTEADSFFPLIRNVDLSEKPQSKGKKRKRGENIGKTDKRETCIQTFIRFRGSENYFAPFSWEESFTFERQIFFWMIRQGYLDRLSTRGGKDTGKFTKMFNFIIQSLNRDAKATSFPIRFKGSSVVQRLRPKTDERMKQFLKETSCFLETDFRLKRNEARNCGPVEEESVTEDPELEDIRIHDFFVIGNYGYHENLLRAATTFVTNSGAENHQAKGGLMNAQKVVSKLRVSMPHALDAPFDMNTVPAQGAPTVQGGSPIEVAVEEKSIEDRLPKRPRVQTYEERLEKCKPHIIRIDELIETAVPEESEFGSFRQLLKPQEEVTSLIRTILKCFGEERLSQEKRSWNTIIASDLNVLFNYAHRNTKDSKLGRSVILRFLDSVQVEHAQTGGSRIKWAFTSVFDFSSKTVAKETANSLFTLVHRWGSEHHGLDADVMLTPYLKGDHWSLFTVYPAEARIVHFNSLQNYMTRREIVTGAKFCVSNLARLHARFRASMEVPPFESWKVISGESIQQKDSVDCGALTLLNAWRVVHGLESLQRDREGYSPIVLRGHIAIKLWKYMFHEELSKSNELFLLKENIKKGKKDELVDISCDRSDSGSTSHNQLIEL